MRDPADKFVEKATLGVFGLAAGIGADFLRTHVVLVAWQWWGVAHGYPAVSFWFIFWMRSLVSFALLTQGEPDTDDLPKRTLLERAIVSAITSLLGWGILAAAYWIGAGRA